MSPAVPPPGTSARPGRRGVGAFPLDGRAIAGFAVALALVAASGVLTRLASTNQAANALGVGRAYDARYALHQVVSDLYEAENRQRAFLLSGDPAQLEPYARATAQLAGRLDALTRLLADDSLGRAQADRARSAVTAAVAELDRSVLLRREGGLEAAVQALLRGTAESTMDSARAALAALAVTQEHLLTERAQRVRVGAARERATVTLLLVLALGVLGGAFALGWRDSAARRRAEAELTASREMLRLILDTVPQRIFWKDLNSVYLGCNRPFAEDSGLHDPAELIGKNDDEMSWRDTAELYRADDRAVMATGEPKLAFEEPGTRRDGTVLTLRTSKVPLRDAEGRVVGVLGTYEDITHQVRMQHELERTVAELQDALRHVSQLSGLLPVCAWCRRIVDENGQWHQLEVFIRDHSAADFSHTICPECAAKLDAAG